MIQTLSRLKIDCPEVYIRVHFWTRVFAQAKTSLLRGTTVIRGGSDTLRIFSSGTDK